MTNKKLTLILASLLLCLVGFLGFKLISIKIEDDKAIEEYQSYSGKLYFKEPTSDKQSGTDVSPTEVSEEERIKEVYAEQIKIQKGINWNAFKKTNPDFIGILSIPEMDIWYPVVQNHEDEYSYYLNHTYSGEKNSAGAIFLDYLFDPDLADNHSIIFGHNMKNMTMFGSLRSLIENEWNHKMYVYFYTDEQVLVYRTFSAYLTSPDSTVYYAQLPEDYYATYYEDAISNAQYLSVDKEVEDAYANMNNFLTLSTCHASDHSDYTVVQNILIERIIVNDEENI